VDRTRFEKPPRWWGPKLNPLGIRLFRWLRKRILKTGPRISDIEVRGAEHVRRALDQGQGVLITPNHSVHGDPMVVYEAADHFGSPLYFMAAWQVLGLVNPFRRAFLRMHGCFSVDREGTDRKALTQAVEILKNRKEPLVIFPEGEVYHCNERVTPFRDGPAAMAVMAARKADREIVVVPCGLRYYYVEDPLQDLEELMSRVEDALFWKPRVDLSMSERLYRVASGMLGLKELEYLDGAREGLVPERITFLTDAILGRVEEKYEADGEGKTIPERIKQGRQRAITALENAVEGSDQYQASANDLDDCYLCAQLFSYPGDYVAEHPSIDRLAETLDKFEEDILDLPTATVRAHRRATVVLGEAVPVPKEKKRNAAAELTRTLERRVQQLLDSVELPSRSFELVAPAGPASSADETGLA
jgi:1-acyl-sn-glycerol-3-phosphate acyltransferase